MDRCAFSPTVTLTLTLTLALNQSPSSSPTLILTPYQVRMDRGAFTRLLGPLDSLLDLRKYTATGEEVAAPEGGAEGGVEGGVEGGARGGEGAGPPPVPVPPPGGRAFAKAEPGSLQLADFSVTRGTLGEGAFGKARRCLLLTLARTRTRLLTLTRAPSPNSEPQPQPGAPLPAQGERRGLRTQADVQGGHRCHGAGGAQHGSTHCGNTYYGSTYYDSTH